MEGRVSVGNGETGVSVVGEVKLPEGDGLMVSGDVGVGEGVGVGVGEGETDVVVFGEPVFF